MCVCWVQLVIYSLLCFLGEHCYDVCLLVDIELFFMSDAVTCYVVQLQQAVNDAKGGRGRSVAEAERGWNDCSAQDVHSSPSGS